MRKIKIELFWVLISNLIILLSVFTLTFLFTCKNKGKEVQIKEVHKIKKEYVYLCPDRLSVISQDTKRVKIIGFEGIIIWYQKAEIPGQLKILEKTKGSSIEITAPSLIFKVPDSAIAFGVIGEPVEELFYLLHLNN